MGVWCVCSCIPTLVGFSERPMSRPCPTWLKTPSSWRSACSPVSPHRVFMSAIIEPYDGPAEKTSSFLRVPTVGRCRVRTSIFGAEGPARARSTWQDERSSPGNHPLRLMSPSVRYDRRGCTKDHLWNKTWQFSTNHEQLCRNGARHEGRAGSARAALVCSASRGRVAFRAT